MFSVVIKKTALKRAAELLKYNIITCLNSIYISPDIL